MVRIHPGPQVNKFGCHGEIALAISCSGGAQRKRKNKFSFFSSLAGVAQW